MLYVEDIVAVGNGFVKLFRRSGWEVEWTRTGKEALHFIDGPRTFDLFVFDWCLPDELQGLDLCKRARQRVPSAGIALLSGFDVGDYKIAALKAGADDYLTKDMSAQEIMARIAAIHRRSSSSRGVFRSGPLEVDFIHCEVLVGERRVFLTAPQLRVLLKMIEHPGTPIAREILRSVADVQRDEDGKSIRSLIHHLRLHLGPAGGLIETKRGFGYGIRVKGRE